VKPTQGKGKVTTMKLNTIEALDKYNINFDVRKVPVTLASGTPVPNVNAMVRTDTLQPFEGVSVSDTYEVVQTRDFADIIERVTGRFQADFINGGSFKEGRVVHLQCKLPDTIRVLDTDDVIEKYLTFVNSFDGSSRFLILPTSIRIFCQNQMPALNADARDRGLRFSHTRSVRQRIKQADEAILSAMNAYRKTEETINQLASTQFTDQQFEQVNRMIFGVKDDVEEIPTRTKNAMDKTRDLFESGIGLDRWRGTAWAAYNAATEYSDHHRSLRATTNKLESQLMGSGLLFKQKALGAIMNVAA